MINHFKCKANGREFSVLITIICRCYPFLRFFWVNDWKQIYSFNCELFIGVCFIFQFVHNSNTLEKFKGRQILNNIPLDYRNHSKTNQRLMAVKNFMTKFDFYFKNHSNSLSKRGIGSRTIQILWQKGRGVKNQTNSMKTPTKTVQIPWKSWDGVKNLTNFVTRECKDRKLKFLPSDIFEWSFKDLLTNNLKNLHLKNYFPKKILLPANFFFSAQRCSSRNMNKQFLLTFSLLSPPTTCICFKKLC